MITEMMITGTVGTDTVATTTKKEYEESRKRSTYFCGTLLQSNLN